MPNKEFLENYALYQKFKAEIPEDIRFFEKAFGKPSVHLNCLVCDSEQTFLMATDSYFKASYESTTNSNGKILHLDYWCAGCKTFHRSFLIKVSDKLDYFMKVGQYPALDISIDKNISKGLGTHKELFKKGLICESQGYGIGAYAYYRRIVELIIDELLDDIYDLVDSSGKAGYKEALDKTKKTTVVAEKIALVKDILPDSLRPSGMNPLGALYENLSEGIHEKSDDECIEIAKHIKTILVYLITQVIKSKQDAKEFTESMKSLLQKKSGK